MTTCLFCNCHFLFLRVMIRRIDNKHHQTYYP
ncbi:protein arginine N-methyltransferase 3 zinc finger domain [Caudoviricetes sp.]|nr:protein arginine N-methyltransferase 3 zinc finger domain [Caudoviricetes sp.]